MYLAQRVTSTYQYFQNIRPLDLNVAEYALVVVHFDIFNAKVRWTTRQRDVKRHNGKSILQDSCWAVYVPKDHLKRIKLISDNFYSDLTAISRLTILGYYYLGSYNTSRPDGWVEQVKTIDLHDVTFIELPETEV